MKQEVTLEGKLDALTAQMQVLAEYVEEQRRRQREWDELKADLTPIVNDVYLASVEQLAEIESDFQLEDLLYLLKRLARNTRNLEYLLDQLESARDLLSDLTPIANEAVASAVTTLDDLDRRGYFVALKEARTISDNIVAAFGPQDIRQLGENVVTILTTVKEMTQPEVMATVQNLAHGVRQAEAQPQEVNTSVWGLLKQFRDPQVRRGLAVTLGMLKAVGAENAPSTTGRN
ncbi:MAG: DUF1641 domain-containing protein [Caldilineales bacterium]|nr:DUF1641 domain-containing protein [Caldilineales bacterium]